MKVEQPIPFSLSPPGFAPRGQVLSTFCFLCNARRIGVVMKFRTFTPTHLIYCLHQKASFVKLLTIPALSH